jgi:hypothetical protein
VAEWSGWRRQRLLPARFLSLTDEKPARLPFCVVSDIARQNPHPSNAIRSAAAMRDRRKLGIHCYFRRRAYGPAIAGSEHSDIDD